MLMGSASYMDKKIGNFEISNDHKGHTAELRVGFYAGSGEHNISYHCSCGKKTWDLGTADPDLIDDDIWGKNKIKK